MAAPAAGVVVAAGRGARLDADRPKGFVELGGRPLLLHALAACAAAGLAPLVLVVPAEHVDSARVVVHGADAGAVRVCAGGTTRQASVRAGVGMCGDAEIVAVHDAARPLASAALIARCVAALVPPWLAVAPALPVVDTLKAASGDPPRVERTVPREGLWAVQTPQVFRRDVLLAAHAAAAGAGAPDDLALVEALGGEVRLVEGERRALKITYAEDLVLAEALLRPAT